MNKSKNSVNSSNNVKDKDATMHRCEEAQGLEPEYISELEELAESGDSTSMSILVFRPRYFSDDRPYSPCSNAFKPCCYDNSRKVDVSIKSTGEKFPRQVLVLGYSDYVAGFCSEYCC